MSKKLLLKKTAIISASTMLSRLLGIIRETLTIRYLGATALSDAFFTAFKIPNTLRKAFAEGALSAAVVPVLTARVHNDGKASINGLMSLFFIIFEFFVFLLCIVVMIWAREVISVIAPGFTAETITMAAHMLRILMPFIISVSMSALFAGALQADNRFFIPAIGPVILNLVIIGTLLYCLGFHAPVSVLCWGILCGGILQCAIHYYAYLRAGFGFSSFGRAEVVVARKVLVRFFLCLPSISLMELSSFIDTSFASLLKPGSVSLLYLANRFIGIPLGVFAVAFATVLLPHLSRVVLIAPKRLSFYLLEGAKLVWWVSLPAGIMISFFAKPLFATLFLPSGKFTIDQVVEAASILRVFVLGLFFFSFNKVILNAYYAMHVTVIPAIIAACTAFINIVFNFLLINPLQATGLALATSLSAMVQTILLLSVLHYKYRRPLYVGQFMRFTLLYTCQVCFFFILFWMVYMSIERAIIFYASPCTQRLMLNTIAYWVWVGPLGLSYCGALWYSRSWMNQKIYFLQ
jgi:putative peptidoglycan lipid II flippase